MRVYGCGMQQIGRTFPAAVAATLVGAIVVIAPGTASAVAPTVGARSGAAAPDPAPVTGQSGSLIAAYSLIAPKGVAKSQLLTRAVTTPGSCPTLTVKDSQSQTQTLSMTRRSPAPGTGNFFTSVTVCERPMPTKMVSAKVGGKRVPAAIPTNIDRIALFADTGCRIEQFRGQVISQDCNDPDQWPLAKIAQQIANAQPDVILNPGDYFYREADCPVSLQSSCGGSPPIATGVPFKDTSDLWLKDVIRPMRPIFPVAPVLMLRGNHEACDRGGNGFMLFFDPRPSTAATCAPLSATQAPVAATPTWFADLDLIKSRSLRLANVDSAYGSDGPTQSAWVPTQTKLYQAAANGTKPQPGRESWLLTHRPIMGHTGSHWLSLDQELASLGLLGNYNLILSSHIHLTQTVWMANYPPNLIMGNGGTKLDAAPQPLTSAFPVTATPPFTVPAATDWSSSTFGFAVAEPGTQANRWRITHLGVDGKKFAGCYAKTRQMTCS